MEISPTPKLSMKFDDAFSIGIGLEHARITGSVRGLWMSGSPAKTRNKKDWPGSLITSPMPKSVISSGIKYQLLRKCVFFFTYLLSMG